MLKLKNIVVKIEKNLSLRQTHRQRERERPIDSMEATFY
jgi:hypothetical protein